MLFTLLAAAVAAPPPSSASVAQVLDAFHHAAAVADGDTYFALLTRDAVFVGTDATERWPREAFEAFARPHFEGETAWVYVAIGRHVVERGAVAWFDEALHNDKYGDVRGSGVLERTPAGWRIAQYVLSFPVPNEVAGEVVERIKAHEAGPTDP